jgi:uncharacterized repeat protein (TIGR02543 family)
MKIKIFLIIILTNILCLKSGAFDAQAQNLLVGWDGTGKGTTTDVPTNFGWIATPATTWGAANSSSNDRYRDDITYNSNTARVLATSQTRTRIYAFPFTTTSTLKFYTFSGKFGLINGGDNPGGYTIGINTTSDNTGISYASKNYSSAQTSLNTNVSFSFCAPVAGNYYFTYLNTSNNRAIFTDLSIVELGDARSVTFNTGGGSAVYSQYFLAGESYTVSKPADPTRAGYIFKGWYADEEFIAEYNFSSPVTSDITIYAKWENITVNFRANFMSGWDGNGIGVTTDKPDAFGWSCSSSVTWADASDSNDAYAYRYRDNLGVGRVITHPVNNNVFSFPVVLNAGKMYQFSCRNSNINATCTAMFGINTSSDADGTMLKSQTKTSSKWSATTEFDFIFAVAEAGTYYLVWQTTSGSDRNLAWDFLLTETDNAFSVTFDTDGGSTVPTQYFAEGEQYLVVEPTEPVKEGYTFAGWYADSSYETLFNFSAPISVNTTVFARFVSEDSPMVNVLIEDEIVTIQSAKYMNITVRGNAELHISSSPPLDHSKINLDSENSWLYFESAKPSEVISDWLSDIQINGQAFNQETDRIAIYAGGSVIIPNGKEIGKNALTIYTAENYGGESKSLEVNNYYREAELGENFNNKIRSFILKKGYSCTFANNPDGTGHSRVFIANDEDLEVSSMPEGLEFASFVRVLRWEWISKKGICGGLAEITQSSWFNDWAAGGDTENPDYEYVPMRHNLGWDSFETINSRTNVSHVLGFNEPDHTDQANCTPLQAIQQWPELFKSGLRLGSPTPDAIRKQWLVDFLVLADKLNYRVDFVVGHMYWNDQSGSNLKNGIADAVTRLYGNRPMWITEFNNGANWTAENWPTASGPQRDADCNIIYDGSGNTTTVNRPLSPENAAKQLAWIKDVLPALDESPYLERHSLYNWVQDARAIVLGDKLTPAGKYFAEYKSKVAFSKSQEYIHLWKIAPPLINTQLSEDCHSFELSWYDHNGETGQNYVLEKKKTSDNDFVVIETFDAGTDYSFGGTVKYTDTSISESAEYRVRATSYKSTLSEYSDVVSFTLDPALTTASVVSGEALSTSIIQVNWTQVANARFYTLLRSSENGLDFVPVVENTTDLTHIDEGLTENTSYQYKVIAANSWGNISGEAVSLTTKSAEAPTQIDGIYVASGDKQATLTWNFQYDVKYRIHRAEEAGGDYQLIADDIDVPRYVDKGLTNNKIYYYKIEAFNSVGSYQDAEAYKATPKDSRYAYYDFNENAGNVAHDQWGGFHGTLENNTVWEVTSSDATVVSLTGANQSYVKLGDGLTTELEDFTISMLINMSSKSSRIFSFGENTGTFMVFMPNMRYKITCPAGTYDITATEYTLPLNEWVHLTITQEGTTFKMYHDGIEFYSDDNCLIKPSDMGVNTNNFLVKSHFGSDGYSSCKFDEFRIYSRALSQAEIAGIIIAGFPATSDWSPEGNSTDWTLANNWSDGVPGEITKVNIPKSTSYPVLTTETTVDEIHFEAGAELGRQDLLTCNEATVEYAITTPDRWYMLSVPIQGIKTESFYHGGNPSVYLKKFYPAGETVNWKSITSLNEDLTIGDGFVYQTKGAVSGTLVGNLVSNPTNVLLTPGSVNDDGYGDSPFAVVGNPFMTTIDFEQFAATNSQQISPNYLIWTGAGFTGFTPNGVWGTEVPAVTPAPTTDYGPITPLQSFFVEHTGENDLSLTFNVETHSANPTERGVLRSVANPSDKLTIVAGTGKSSVLTFIANREGGQNTLSSKDARKLFAEINDLPDIYTLKPSEKGLIAVGANIINSNDIDIPVGISTTYRGNLTLTFEGMDNYQSDITLIDKFENRVIPLTGLDRYEYTFNYEPAVDAKQSILPTNDRFVIRFAPTTATDVRAHAEQTLSVFGQNGAIHALSAASDPIRRIAVYNVQGIAVYQNNQVNSPTCITDPQAVGVYIVKVTTEKKEQTVKLIIK